MDGLITGQRLALLIGVGLYFGLSVVWLGDWIPEPLRTYLLDRYLFLFLQGPPLALRGARYPMLLSVYLAGTLVCAWLFLRVARARTSRERVVGTGWLLIAWCSFGLLAASPFA
jgi:hypothetical protein